VSSKSARNLRNVVQFLDAGGFSRVLRVVNTVTKLEFTSKVVNLSALRAEDVKAAESGVYNQTL